jgi:hypothetical protein
VGKFGPERNSSISFPEGAKTCCLPFAASKPVSTSKASSTQNSLEHTGHFTSHGWFGSILASRFPSVQ